MKNLILRTAVILATATTLFYSGCNDNGADSDVTGGGHVDDLINSTRGTNEPKTPESYTLKVTASPTIGGSTSKSPDKTKYSKGESVMVTATAKAGYRFAGWTGDTASTNKDVTIKMDDNKELIANFLLVDVVSYTLTINTSPKDCGTVSKSPDKLEYAAGDMVYVVAASKPGYAFTIWSGASSSRDSAITITMNDKKELTANFAPRTYTLTANAEIGGTVSRNPSKSAYDYEEKVIVTAYPDNNYKFKEWSGAATGTKNPITVTIDGDRELTAKFEWKGTTPPPNVPDTKYTLTAYPSPTNGGEVSRSPDKNAYTAHETVIVTASPANGYKFTGWSGSSTSTNTSITVTMDGDKTLTANFELISYTVTFDVNGGNGLIPDQNAQAGNSIMLPSENNLSKDGSTFGGWNTNRFGTGINYSANSYYTVTASVTLYAVWNEISIPIYTVDFNANGGIVNPTSGTTGESGKLTTLPTPTRTGYTFDGWYTASTGGTEVSESRVYSANTTIYARWTEIPVTPSTYTITFDANGGTVSPTTATTGPDGRLASLPTPTRTGYNFNGWYTGETGGTAIPESRVYSANVTIYAQWTAEPVTPPSGTTFVDSRDSKAYKKVVIGTQTWMAENLNYDVPDVATDVCYGNSADSCAKYGRLYNWSTAMGGASSSSLSPSGVQGVCPANWHLPSDAEWTTLTDYVGSSTAGKKLKSTTGWYVNYGTDDYGFSALPGGNGSSDGSFSRASSNGYWWSATQYSSGVYGSSSAWLRDMYYSGVGGVDKAYYGKSNLFSVRCVAD